MRELRLGHPTDLTGWRAQARVCVARRIPPDAVSWRVGDDPPDLLTLSSLDTTDAAPPLAVPRLFVVLAERVVCHRDPARFGLLYRLLWRMAHGERRLLDVATDPDVHRATAMARSVHRDSHKMKAFVRFRCVCLDGAEHFIAWFEPQHYIVERVGPFFAQRFAGMRWSILTPDRSAHWDGTALTYAPGADRSRLPAEDALETVWRHYYASIFNPARLNLRAMQGQMPKRYWKNLPEAALIASLAAEAGDRTKAMLAAGSGPAASPQSDRKDDDAAPNAAAG